jgi:hypothetical protein
MRRRDAIVAGFREGWREAWQEPAFPRSRDAEQVYALWVVLGGAAAIYALLSKSLG